MSKISVDVLLALQDELQKFAATPMPAGLSSVLGAGGAGAGAGAFGGALLGAGLEGVRGYRRAKEEGATTAQAMGQGALRSTKGILPGAALGGGLGALGGGATALLSPGKGEAFRKALSSVPGSHFGQRQVHSLTGWVPEGGLASIGHGSSLRAPAVAEAEGQLAHAHAMAPWRKKLEEAQHRSSSLSSVASSPETDLARHMADADTRAATAALKGTPKPGLFDKIMGRDAVQSAEHNLTRAKASLQAGVDAEGKDLTSIPGYLRSLKNDPKGTLQTAFNDQWNGTTPVMKALMVGLPAADVAYQMHSDDAPDEQGRSKGRRVGSALASTAGGMLLSPLTQMTQMAAGHGLNHVGGLVGQGVDRLRGKAPTVMAPRAPDLTADSGQAVASERVVSERAAGMGGEGSPT